MNHVWSNTRIMRVCHALAKILRRYLMFWFVSVVNFLFWYVIFGAWCFKFCFIFWSTAKSHDFYVYILSQECKTVEKGHNFYDFQFNTRLVKSTIVHFQVQTISSDTALLSFLLQLFVSLFPLSEVDPWNLFHCFIYGVYLTSYLLILLFLAD